MATIIELHALSNPELRKAEGMVYEIWEDGEITLQKSGSLYGLRSLHCIVPGLKGVNIGMPDVRSNNHSCMAIAQSNLPLARAIMVEVSGVIDPFRDVIPGAKKIEKPQDLIDEINARNTKIFENE